MGLDNEVEDKMTYTCPEGHDTPYEKWNFAKDFSDNLIGADMRPMFEVGLYCNGCDRAYGLSKLIQTNSE